MTTVQNHQQSYAPLPDDIYDPDDVVFPGSPPLQPLKVNVRPSPTPPFMVPIPPSPLDINSGSPSGTSRRKEARRPKIAPSQSDAGLVGIMADGRAPDIAWRAGNELLAADPDDDDDPAMNGSNHVEVEVEVDEVGMGTETGVGGEVGGEAVRGGECDSARTEREKEAMENDGLALVAAQAVDALMKAQGASPPQKQIAMSKSPRGGGELADEARSAISPIPPRTAAHLDGSRSPLSPESAAQSDVQTSAAGELPPIRQLSSNTGLINGSGGPITLPSITAQLGDINHLPEPPSAGESPYAQSPPARPPPLFAAAPSHGSPPKSPNDTFRRELPSPGRAPFFNYNNAHRRPSQSEAIHYSSAGDYSSANTETPSTDQSGATPAIDRMSIDGITNPQIGGFQCTHPGCTAQPFQTQVCICFEILIEHCPRRRKILTLKFSVSAKLAYECPFTKPPPLLYCEGLPKKRGG